MRKEHHLQFNAIERKMYFLKILKTQASFVIRSGSMWVGATNGRFLDRCLPLLLTVCFKEFIKKKTRDQDIQINQDHHNICDSKLLQEGAPCNSVLCFIYSAFLVLNKWMQKNWLQKLYASNYWQHCINALTHL